MTEQDTTLPYRILIVEDEALSARRIERLLTHLGHQITGIVSTAEQALGRIEADPPDLALMDIKLPGGMNGIEAAAQIRAQFNVPVVYLSAHPELLAQAPLQRLQPCGFLSKPIRGQDLQAAIEMALYRHRLEAQFREREAQYRLLAENIDDVIWQMDRTLDRYTYVSPSVTRLLGYTPKEVMAMPVAAHLTPASRKQLQAAASSRLSAERAGRGDDDTRIWEMQYIHRDGHTVWVESRTRPLRDEEGAFQGLVGVTRGIDERKRAETALRESRERLELTLEGAELGMWDWNIASGDVVFNERWAEMLGYRLDEIEPRIESWEKLMHPDDAERVRQVLDDHLHGRTPIYQVEQRLRTKSGEWKWILDTGKVFERDPEGRPLRAVGIHQDITARQETERALRESEERFRLLAENARDLIYRIRFEPEQHFEYVSPSATEITGYTPQDHYDDPMLGFKLVHPDDVPLLQAVAEGKTDADTPLVLRWVRKDGSILWAEQHNTPIYDDEGNLAALEGIARDITARKQVEEALRERMKELNCLYAVNRDLQRGLSIHDLCRRTIVHLVGGIQFPNMAVPVIVLDGERFTTEKYRPHLSHGLHAEICVGNEQRGQVSLYYAERRSFLMPEEQNLIEGVAEAIGLWLERKQIEEALRESEQKLRSLIEQSPTSIVLCDQEGRIVTWNAAQERLSGIPEQEALGNLMWDMAVEMAPQEQATRQARERTAAAMQELMRSGEISWPRGVQEQVIQRPDGTQRIVETEVFAVATQEGYMLCSMAQDVTARKEAEQQLRTRLRYEEHLARVSQVLLHDSGQEDTMIQALDHLQRATDAARVYMFENFVDDGGQLCMRQTHEVCVPGIKPQIDNPQLGRLAYADGFERWANVLSQGDPIRGPVDALPPAERAILASQDILSILVLPIEIGHAWSGFIGFDETRFVREWSDEDVRLLQTAAEMIESYIERKQAQDARRRYVERLRILREIDAAILSAQSPQDIACVALERLYALIPYQYASIGEIDLEQQRGRDVVILSPEGVVEGSSSVWHPLAEGWEVVERTRRGEIYVVQDIAALERLSPMEQYLEQAGVRAYVSVPMMVREDLVGSLNLAVDRPGFFQPGYLEILGEMADSLSVAMQQASLLAQTQQDAEAKTMLLREVNHRVTNNLIMILSIIELEMDQQRTSEAGSDLGVVLQDIHDRIQGISAVHRMLSSAQQDALAPADVVSQVIEAAMSGSSIRQQVVVQVDAPGYVPSISSKQGVTLALIVNELTTNSIKYAFRDRSRGRIEVHMAMVEGDTQALRLTYRDDGPGMPREVLDGERQSVGLWLVRANVTHTLGGQVSWYNDGGAVFEIEFPLDTRA